MDAAKRPRVSLVVAVLAVALLIIAVAVSTALMGGSASASGKKEPAVPEDIAPFRDAHPSALDLQCSTALSMEVSSTFADAPQPVTVSPEPEVVRQLILDLGRSDGVPEPVTVAAATSEIAGDSVNPTRDQPTDLFVGLDGDGKVTSIVALGVVNGKLTVTSFAACSASPEVPEPEMTVVPIPGPGENS